LKTYARLTVLLCAFCLSSSSLAHAGIMEWIDQLSGPGPFWGVALEARLHCFDADKPPDIPARKSCLNRLGENKRRLITVNFSAAIAWAAHNDLPYANSTAQKGVKLISFEPAVWWYPIPPVALGVSAGVDRFSGPAFETFYRGYVTPVQVEIKPFAIPRSRWGTNAEIFTVRTGYMLIPEGFDAKDFGAIGSFSTRHEALPTITVLLDFESFKMFR
jgi:hypothetical protein